MTLFNPVFNCLTPIVIKRSKTQADEGLTPADEAGSVVLRQPPASKLANLFRIDVRDHALGLVTQQLGGRVTEHPPGGWLGPRTPSLREGPGSASVPSGSPESSPRLSGPARPCGRGKLAQFSLLQRFAVWWVAPPWPILPVPAVLLALCRLVVFSQFGDGFTDIVEPTTQLLAQDSFHLPAQGIAVVAGEHPRQPTQQLGRALEFHPKPAQVLIELLRKSQELSLPRTRVRGRNIA